MRKADFLSPSPSSALSPPTLLFSELPAELKLEILEKCDEDALWSMLHVSQANRVLAIQAFLKKRTDKSRYYQLRLMRSWLWSPQPFLKSFEHMQISPDSLSRAFQLTDAGVLEDLSHKVLAMKMQLLLWGEGNVLDVALKIHLNILSGWVIHFFEQLQQESVPIAELATMQGSRLCNVVLKTCSISQKETLCLHLESLLDRFIKKGLSLLTINPGYIQELHFVFEKLAILGASLVLELKEQPPVVKKYAAMTFKLIYLVEQRSATNIDEDPDIDAPLHGALRQLVLLVRGESLIDCWNQLVACHQQSPRCRYLTETLGVMAKHIPSWVLFKFVREIVLPQFDQRDGNKKIGRQLLEAISAYLTLEDYTVLFEYVVLQPWSPDAIVDMLPLAKTVFLRLSDNKQLVKKYIKLFVDCFEQNNSNDYFQLVYVNIATYLEGSLFQNFIAWFINVFSAPEQYMTVLGQLDQHTCFAVLNRVDDVQCVQVGSQFIECLQHSNLQVQGAIVRIVLGCIPLIPPSPLNRCIDQAIDLLSHDQAAIQPILTILGDNFDSLSEPQQQAYLDALITLCQSTQLGVGSAVEDTLIRLAISSADSLSQLEEKLIIFIRWYFARLVDGFYYVKKQAAKVLSMLLPLVSEQQKSRIFLQLENLLFHENHDVRCFACKSLGSPLRKVSWGDIEKIKALMTRVLLDDQSDEVKLAAANILLAAVDGLCCDKAFSSLIQKDVAVWVAGLQHDNMVVRQTVCQILASLLSSPNHMKISIMIIEQVALLPKDSISIECQFFLMFVDCFDALSALWESKDKREQEKLQQEQSRSLSM